MEEFGLKMTITNAKVDVEKLMVGIILAYGRVI